MSDIKKKRAPATDTNQRAWAQVYDDMNDVINSVNQKSAVESRNGTSGGDGDIRLFKDVDRTKYFIEGKFADGWAKRELLFSDLSNDTQDESINFSSTEPYVKPDGSVPFTGQILGIAPSNDLHLATKKYVDDLSATEDTLSELNDTTITSVANGNMLKYDTGTNTWINFAANFLPSYAVNDSYTGSSLNPTVFGLKQTGTSSVTTIRGVRSANNNMTITLEESLESGAYLKFNVASPTGITSVTGYDVGSDDYDSAVTGNTSLKFNDDYDTGSSTGIFFEVTDSGNDTIVTPNIVGSLSDTTYAAMGSGNSYAAGLVLAGSNTHANSFLRKDGSWQVPVDTNTDTNTQNTYTSSWVDSTDDVLLRLTGGGATSGTQDIKLVAGSNIYLTPSGANMTIAANNTTSYALTNSSSSGQQATLVTVNTGAAGKLRGFKQGSNITISSTDDGVDGDGYITIAASLSGATINVSEVNPSSGYFTWDSADIRFIDNGRITWELGRPGSNVTTVTPTITNPSAADVGAVGTSSSFGGDVSGTYNNIAVSNDSHTHDTRYYTETELNNGQLNNLYFTESEINTKLALKANLASPTFTGTVTCEVIRLSSDTDVSATSTGHGLQVGPTNSYNFAIDNNELIARNNGAISTLHLSPDGGPTTGSYENISVTMNHNVSGGRINIYENGDVDCLNLKARADVWAYTSSDPSLKDNKNIIESPLDMISKIGGYSFDWNSKAASHLKGHDYGVMANEIESVMPELVTTRENGIKAVRYDGIIPLLIEAIKELKNEVSNGVCCCK
jgi:hypothetical protein